MFIQPVKLNNMFIQPVSVFVINAYFLGLNMVALRVVVERKIPMMSRT